MADSVKALVHIALGAGLSVGLGAVAQGQNLPDPTRPPQAGGGVESDAPAQRSNVLQTVLVPRHGRPTAIIGGVQVFVGDKVGEAKVVRITESEVVLEGPEGKQVLPMAPNVTKRPAAKAKTTRSESAQEKGKP